MPSVDNRWYAQFCNLCAANVLNKEGQVRFSYEQLHQALNDPDGAVSEDIVVLERNIINACNKQYGTQDPRTGAPLRLTLLNIHAAYLMLTGAWKMEPEQPKQDELGFEIF